MKAYTDLSQSRKLADILPLESADMFYDGVQDLYKEKVYNIPINGSSITVRTGHIITKKGIKANLLLTCWSLAALMSVFPKEEGSCVSISYGYYDANGNYVNSWLCCYEKEGDSTDDYIIETTTADNPIDACVAMILKLKERNLL